MTEILSAKVSAGARQTSVIRREDGSLKITVKAAPERGKANEAVCRAIAEYLHVSLSCVSIHSGHTSTHKLIRIHDDR
ncbi:MAG TPA: DUF167 domain-containing protein [bacterium]|nr:DUF167 domain-containing protein [bacterium]